MKIDLLGWIFPRRCPVCHEIVEDGRELCCKICRGKLPYVSEPFCMKCGKPVLSDEIEFCRDCTSKKHVYRKGRAPFLYDHLMKQSIAKFKYEGRQEYAAFYAEEILRKCGKEMRLWGAEVLVPIPLHAGRRRKRGYNQAELLAKELSKRSGIPVDTKLIFRKKKTKAQKNLDHKERYSNLKNAFSIREGNIPYHKIILVDDIYTTGSTIDEAARILQSAGIQTVFFLCICVGNGT